MRIVFLNRMAATRIGGGEHVMFQLIDELAHRGHEINLITARPVFASGIERETLAKKYLFRSPFIRYWAIKRKLPYPFPAIGVILDAFLFSRRAVMILRRLYKEKSVDTVFLTGFPKLGAWIEQRIGIPVIVRMPGPPDQLDMPYLSRVSAVIANGDAYKQLATCDVSRLYDIPPGIESMFFARPQNVPSFDDRKVMLFVGRFSRIKNLPFLLKVIDRVRQIEPEVLLVLVGDGEMKDELVSRVTEKQLEYWVRFVNPTYGMDLVRYYHAADLLVLCSFYDNFPNVINEAMAAGLPVVAADVGGVSLQVQDGETGYLVPSGDLDKFTSRVIELLGDRHKSETFGAEGRRRARRYTWEYAGDQVEEVIMSVL